MRDIRYNRLAAVIFRDPCRLREIGAGFKQLPLVRVDIWICRPEIRK
jgi:hypothetical protein